MAKTKADVSSSISKKRRPALTPESRENQMIALAIDTAERQMMEGTASSQVITHFLKLGTEKERLEREKLRRENIVLEAKAKAYESSERIEELYKNAIDAMKGYAGFGSDDDEYED